MLHDAEIAARHVTRSGALYPEEQVANLIDHLRVAAGLAAREALERCQGKVRRMREVEYRLHAIQIFGWLIGERAIFHPDAPLAAPLAIHLDANRRIHAL